MREYLGMPGHFIGSYHCLFRLNTHINRRYRVSTVGAYYPPSSSKNLPEEVGPGRLYETLVFRLDSNGEICMGEYLDFSGYTTLEDATDGHEAMCRKWESEPSVEGIPG